MHVSVHLCVRVFCVYVHMCSCVLTHVNMCVPLHVFVLHMCVCAHS